jgi:hypothetical protein
MPPFCWYVIHLGFGSLKVLPFMILLSFWKAGIYSGRLDTYICSGVFWSHVNNTFDVVTFTRIPMFCIVNCKLCCVIYSLSYQSGEGFMFQVRFFLIPLFSIYHVFTFVVSSRPTAFMVSSSLNWNFSTKCVKSIHVKLFYTRVGVYGLG